MSTRTKRLYLEDVTVSFDGFEALNALTLYVDPGELLCIVGPNGAGKTTMMDVITGKTGSQHSTVFFGDGLDLGSMSEAEIVAAGIGRKFQKPTVVERHTVMENLELAHTGNRPFLKALTARFTVEMRVRMEEVLGIIGLKDQRHSAARILAHGQKQWLQTGMLRMQNPDLLLVDEPVAGMTPQEIERTAELLVSLKGKHSVVVVEPDMAFVRSIAHRVVVRTRPGAGTHAADSRRTDGRHPAEHGSRNRRHHCQAQPGSRPDRAAGGAEAALCPPYRQRILHPR